MGLIDILGWWGGFHPGDQVIQHSGAWSITAGLGVTILCPPWLDWLVVWSSLKNCSQTGMLTHALALKSTKTPTWCCSIWGSGHKQSFRVQIPISCIRLLPWQLTHSLGRLSPLKPSENSAEPLPPAFSKMKTCRSLRDGNYPFFFEAQTVSPCLREGVLRCLLFLNIFVEMQFSHLYSEISAPFTTVWNTFIP